MTPYASGRDWTLYSGDALAVIPTLAQGSVSAVITDPPYSSGGFTRGDRMLDARAKYASTDSATGERVPSFSGDNRDQRGYLAWSALWLGMCLDIVPEGAPLACFTDWRQLPTMTDAVQAGGWVWRGIVPWHKPVNRSRMGWFAGACEYVVWGSAGPAPERAEVGCLRGFYEGSAPMGDARVHLTQKPAGVVREIVRVCPPGGTVLDPFAGSGTTGEAALLEGRRCVLIERSTEYLPIIAARMTEIEADGFQPTLLGAP